MVISVGMPVIKALKGCIEGKCEMKPLYIVVKKFDRIGSIAYQCKNLSEARSVPGTLDAIREENVQVVILDDPYIYSEYAPYRFIPDLREFMNEAGNLNLL